MAETIGSLIFYALFTLLILIVIILTFIKYKQAGRNYPTILYATYLGITGIGVIVLLSIPLNPDLNKQLTDNISLGALAVSLMALGYTTLMQYDSNYKQDQFEKSINSDLLLMKNHFGITGVQPAQVGNTVPAATTDPVATLLDSKDTEPVASAKVEGSSSPSVCVPCEPPAIMGFNLDYFGEWLQNLSTGIVGGLVTGFLVSFLIILPQSPEIAPYLIGSAFLIAIIMIANLIVQCYRECKQRRANTITPATGQTPNPERTVPTDAERETKWFNASMLFLSLVVTIAAACAIAVAVLALTPDKFWIGIGIETLFIILVALTGILVKNWFKL